VIGLFVDIQPTVHTNCFHMRDSNARKPVSDISVLRWPRNGAQIE